jgi:Zn-dependent protease
MDGIDLEFIRNGLITFILLVVSLAIHEWAHAFAADRLGDDTPRSQGRVTLNPVAHMDLLGTVIFPLFGIFVLQGSFALIGWGKPVVTNPANFRHRRRDDILTTLAGPGANLALALLGVLGGTAVVLHAPRLSELLGPFILMNVALAVFNLLPIPPLDGGLILRTLTGMTEERFNSISRWSGWLLLLAINIPVVERVFSTLLVIACLPYIYLSHGLNPYATPLLFPMVVRT